MLKRKNICKNKRILSLAAVLLVVIMVFLFATISCGIGKEKAEENKKTTESEPVGEKEEEITKTEAQITTINTWDCCEPKERIAILDSIENFLDKNPFIKIDSRHFRSQEELEDQFKAASLAGSGPEIILLDMGGVQRLAPEKVVREIKNEVDYARILDGLVEISEYNNKKYIIPFRSTDFLMLYYNKKLIESVPSDFEGIIEYCKKVNNFNEQTYGWLLNSSEPDWIIPFIGGYSDWIIDYSTNYLTLDTKSTEKTLEFLNYIYNEEKILPYGVEYEEIDRLFKGGNVAMIINGTWAIKEYEDDGMDIGISRIPVVWQGSLYPTPLISGLGFMINMNCYDDKLEAAKSFIEYMLSEEVQVSWTINTQTFPVLKDIDKDPAIKGNSLIFNAFQQAKICRGKPYYDLIRAIRDAIRINVENVVTGSITPEEAAMKIQEDAIKLKSGGITVEELQESEL